MSVGGTSKRDHRKIVFDESDCFVFRLPWLMLLDGFLRKSDLKRILNKVCKDLKVELLGKSFLAK